MLLGDAQRLARLAAADLGFEWILTLCMALTLGAVLTPLFIMLGLREGIVGNMLDELRRDPEGRLVTPRYPLLRPLDASTIEALRAAADVLIVSRTSVLDLDVEGARRPVNAQPTVPEDPLLTANGISLPHDPSARAVVLSHRLAILAGKKVGDSFRITLVRDTGYEERVPMTFDVAGILPGSDYGELKVLLPVALFDEIDRWRDGQASPALGLAGSARGLAAQYDGVVALLAQAPERRQTTAMLAHRMAFGAHPRRAADLDWLAADGRVAMLWRPDSGPVRERDVQVLANRHAEVGLDAQLIPYVEPFPVTLRSTRPPVAEPVERRLAIVSEAPDCPTERRRKHPRPCVALAPSSELEGAASGLRAILRITSGGDAPVEVPVRVTVEPRMPVGLLGVSASLAGRMNTARLRNARFDVATGLFQVAGPGNRFFRAYAADVDALEPLLDRVRAAGDAAGLPALMEPWSRFDDVARIRRHADSLQTLFVLIAAVSGASGVFALAANVYAGVQRKRVDLAYLQLLGIPRARLLLFPLVKSMLLVAAGLAIALLAYAVFAHVAAPSLGDVFRQAGELMRLTTADALRLSTLIIAAAMLTSLLAGIAVLRIEPSEHIRD